LPILAGLLLICLSPVLSRAEETKSPRPATCAPPSGAKQSEKLPSLELAAAIDKHLAEHWQKENIPTPQLANDSEFLRRAFLDCIGKIPSVAEAHDFLADTRSDKRQRLVDSLLSRGAHATHFANTWRDLILSGASANFEVRALIPQFDTWLRLRFASGTPYDQIVADLLTSAPRGNTARALVQQQGVPSATAFYQAAEGKPEQLAAITSRVFLGTRVECAQCHDHPFSHWKREQFWSFAAFFTGLENAAVAGGGAADDNPSRRQLKIPETEIVVDAKFLDGSSPDWNSGPSKRAMVAKWITRGDNPFFAAAAVNRVWEHFFGRGFVYPVDNLDITNPPVHPELFELLGRQFVLHDYDLSYLIQAVTATKAYQSTSRTTGAEPVDLEHFARIPLRRMTGDQLYDSLAQATGQLEPATNANNVFAVPVDGSRSEFQQKFSDQSVPRTEAESTILQALSLMNGQYTAGATALQSSETLTAVAESPFLDTKSRVETLFLASLSRPPSADELTEMVAYIDATKTAIDRKAALADVFWALLNGAEFVLCH
jgi:hypothetical protein